MQEFDETKAVGLMLEAIGADKADENLRDSACEVLDLIYDYYESHGELNMSDLDEDSDDDPAAIAAYVARHLAKNGPECGFTPDQLVKMVESEIDYEDSLI